MPTSTVAKTFLSSSVVAGLALAASVVAAPAQALTMSYSGSGFSIPDNNPTGISSDIVISDNLTISDITVTLNNLSHTWVGDLIATLTNVDTNTSVSLFNRVGRVGSGVGSSNDFGGNYGFNDAFTGDLWIAASSNPVPSGGYFPTGADSAALASPSLSAFDGQLSAGTWRLTLSDNAGLDVGSLESWELTVEGAAESVPEPASVLGLLAVGAMGTTSALKRKLGHKAGDDNLN